MKGQTNAKILKQSLQRTLRNGMTDAERKLWSVLRGKQLLGCKFRRQHPYGDYILDFVCLDYRLVVEVDGRQHLDSERDTARDTFMKQSGFTVLRFWNHDVLSDTVSVADAIYRAILDLQATHPLPSPPLEGEGDRQPPLYSDPRHDGEGEKAL